MGNAWVLLGSWTYGEDRYRQNRQQWFASWFDSYEAALLQAERWNQYFEQAASSSTSMIGLEAMVWRTFDRQLPAQELDTDYGCPSYSVNRVPLRVL